MKNFFLNIWEILCGIFRIVTPIVFVMYLAFSFSQIKFLENKNIALTKQITETQVALYDALVQIKVSDLILQEQLLDGLDKAKKDAIKNNNTIMNIIYGVDKRSNDRSQGIVEGVNKVVDQVSYALQKPSYDYLKNITVIVMAKSKDKNALPGHRGWLGTGVIIAIDKDFTYILTNHHVVSQFDDGLFNYYISDGEDKYPITLIKDSKDDDVDMALIRINGHIEGKVAVVGFGPEPSAQDPLYLVGHNLGRPYLYDEGNAAGYDQDGYLIVDMPTGPGNSGSGVINKDGQLVGILFAGSIIAEDAIYQMDTSHGICLDIKHIRLFLAGYIK